MTGCSAAKCSNNSNQKRMFRFPSSPTRRKKWQEYCRRDKWTPNENSRLCEVHFDDSQFENNRVDGKRLLRWYAVPSVYNLPDNSRKPGPKPKNGATNAASRSRRKIFKSAESDGELEKTILHEHSYVTTPEFELNVEIYKDADDDDNSSDKLATDANSMIDDRKPQDLLLRSLQELREQNIEHVIIEELPAVNIEEFLSIEHDMPIELSEIQTTAKRKIMQDGNEVELRPCKDTLIKFKELPAVGERRNLSHNRKLAKLNKEIVSLRQALQLKEDELSELQVKLQHTAAVPNRTRLKKRRL